MNFKSLLFTAFYLLISSFCLAQSNIEAIVKQGVQYHDNGEFDKAIDTYKTALILDPNSPLVNYEIALSYFTKGDYNMAIKHSDIVLDQGDELALQAYMTKGSALDLIGKTKESIALFEKAIKKTDGHYLLYYNLGVNYYKIEDYKNAELNVVKGIESNPNHPSSHLMLANIHNALEHTTQSLLAMHYFLFLEPDSQRSAEAYLRLRETFSGNVSKDEEKPNTINILLSPDKENDFGPAEMMISLLEASKYTDKNEGKSEEALFVENTESYFKILGELNKGSKKDIWWSFYIPFYYELAKSEHLTTYCHYISQSSKDVSRDWLLQNEDKLNDFDQWLKTL